MELCDGGAYACSLVLRGGIPMCPAGRGRDKACLPPIVCSERGDLSLDMYNDGDRPTVSTTCKADTPPQHTLGIRNARRPKG